MSGHRMLAAALFGLATLLGEGTAGAQSPYQDLQQADLETLLAADRDLRSAHLQLEQALDSLNLELRSRQQLMLDTLISATGEQLRQEASSLGAFQQPDSTLMASAWLQQLRAMGQSLQLLLAQCRQLPETAPGSESLLQALSYRAAAADSLLAAVCRPGQALGPLERFQQLDWVRGEYRGCLQDLSRLKYRFLGNAPAQPGTLLLLLYGH